MIVAGADDIPGYQLERLADACDRAATPLTLLFRHLRDDASHLIGGAAATAFMRLGNHAEAEQAASFIGRQHRFVLSSLTATHGGDQTTTRDRTQTWGRGESRSFATPDDWGREHLPGGGSRSRDYSKNYSWAASLSRSDGTSWTDSTTRERVYEYTIEPGVLQRLPDTALLLVNDKGDVQPVECHPAIVRLPQASITPLETVPGHPLLAEAGPYQPQWEPQEEARPSWPPQQPPDRPSWRR